MDIQQKSANETTDCSAGECHCSVCFAVINDVTAATHTLAGRYYCKSCRETFKQDALNSNCMSTAL